MHKRCVGVVCDATQHRRVVCDATRDATLASGNTSRPGAGIVEHAREPLLHRRSHPLCDRGVSVHDATTTASRCTHIMWHHERFMLQRCPRGVS